MLGGIFKTTPNTCDTPTTLSVDREASASSDHAVTSDNAGLLSGLFRRSPKPSPKSAHGQENPLVQTESNQSNQPSSGMFGWIFRNPFGSSVQEREKAEPPGDTHSESTQKTSSCPDGTTEEDSSLNQTGVSSEITDSVLKADETPPIPPRPTQEELNTTLIYRLSLLHPAESDCTQESVQSVDQCPVKAAQDEDHQVNTPFMDDAEECASITSQKDKDGKEETAENSKSTLPKKKIVKKKKNPFMPHVVPKGKVQQKKSGAGAEPVESEVQKKSLMEQLNELRLEKAHKEEEEDLEGLMEWWSTVKQWEQMPKEEDMTEKEEAKAFAVTAEKIQRGIRVFNQLFSERAEGLWQHVIDLRAIADGLDRFNWRTKVAQITGGSTSAVGGVATITGLALAPVTMGTSLIVTAVGLGVAAAGGLTSASAGISNAVNNSMDRKKVERIVEDYQSKMADLNKCMKFIKQGIENLRQFNLLRVKKQAYNRDFPGLNSVYEDGAMASKAILSNANEIMRVVQIANVAGSTAARAVQIASMATGVLTGLFVGMDIYFVTKDSQELRKGAKSEFAAKIREVADQLHEGLVELNTIREELQCSGSNAGAPDTNPAAPPPSSEEHREKSEPSPDSQQA
ncbi:apolipoprotein L1 isoform X1 [Astyanax mexicanus]|uniref:apolipoprotein L1 isoform X1 n=1 Tax=Astyanax mexicanus TaxID=7994 RepID=UPI0020CB1329|nr:apolipoprotein L1 isoform X1 [Astyanax mexicanus]